LTVEGGRTAQAVLENKSFYFKEVKPDDIKNKLSKIAVDIYKLKSMLIIPLDTYGEVFGVISLSTHDKILNLSDADITYIKSFLSQIATAFKTTYFSKLATEKKEQLVKINEFTKKVSSSLDIHDVLNTIISYLTEKFNFEGHIISIAYEDNPQKLNVLDVKIDTLDDNYIDLLKEYGFPLDVEENVIIKSYKTNEIVYLNDSNNENIENDVKEMMQVFNIKSTINIPISLDNKTIGVLTFYTFNNNEMDLTQDDIISLKGFTDQISVAIKNSMLYEKLQHQKKELETRNKIIENDIKMAKKIQESLLPKSNPIFIGFSFSSFYQPMEHLGGDFYDFITIDHENIGILLSDVSGHGVSAAFITSMIKSSLDMDKDDLISPAIFFKKLQKKMLPLLTDKYFTAIYGVLNRKTKTFLYSNAAHIPQLVLRSNENFVEKIILPSNFIGLYVSDTDFFEEKSITLNSNDKILLFTDGFIENMRIKDEKNNINLDKSYDFLSEIFIKHKKLKGDKLINKLILEAKNQNTEEGFFDDIALILIEVF
jgi:serine phosphatase RsbU (regulator of sigma subunit)